MNNNENNQVRILSGINSINFYDGYDFQTKIFDKRKTQMMDDRAIYCFTDGDGQRPNLNDTITRTLLDYTHSVNFWKRGKRYIISGVVNKVDLKVGNFSYVVAPVLKVDKVYRYKNIFGYKTLTDITDKI